MINVYGNSGWKQVTVGLKSMRSDTTMTSSFTGIVQLRKDPRKNPGNIVISLTTLLSQIASLHFSIKKSPILSILEPDNSEIFLSHRKPCWSWRSSSQLFGRRRRSWIFSPPNIVHSQRFSMWSARSFCKRNAPESSRCLDMVEKGFTNSYQQLFNRNNPIGVINNSVISLLIR